MRNRSLCWLGDKNKCRFYMELRGKARKGSENIGKWTEFCKVKEENVLIKLMEESWNRFWRMDGPGIGYCEWFEQFLKVYTYNEDLNTKNVRHTANGQIKHYNAFQLENFKKWQFE